MEEMKYELDYKAMFEKLKSFVNKQFEAEQEFFALAQKLRELNGYQEAFGKNMCKMKMADQVKVMRVALMLAELQKQLCEKYGFDDEVEVTEYD